MSGPGGEPWEVYTVLADAGTELEGKTLLDVASAPAAGGGGCCGTDAPAGLTDAVAVVLRRPCAADPDPATCGEGVSVMPNVDDCCVETDCCEPGCC